MPKVIDFAWAQIPATWIKAQGYDGIARYISHDSSKNLSAPEIANARAAGLSIYVVFESTANRSTQGQQAGHDDALFANQALDALGYPKGCAVAYAVDFDASWSQVAPYFAGVASAGLRPWAPYGSSKIADACNSPAPPWQTAAWSGGLISSRAGLYQDRFDVPSPYGAFDINEVRIADYGQWTTATPTPQPQKEDEMRVLFTHNGGEYIGVPGDWCRAVPTQGLWDFYKRAGVPVNNVDGTAEVQADVFGQMTLRPVQG